MNDRIVIYQVIVATITANEGRRQRATTAYLSMIAAITTVAAAIPGLPLIVPASVILVIALTWLATVQYFRRLAQAKFAVIAEIEKDLEFSAFKLERQYSESKRKFFHMKLTHLEMILPVLAILGSTAYILHWIIF